MSTTEMLAERLAVWWDKAWLGLAPADKLMLIVGIVGQSLFVVRWFIQLAASEREKRSVVPALFWYFSFAGSMLVLVYALHKADLVLMLGQFGIVIYARNLYLIAMRGRPAATASEPTSDRLAEAKSAG